MLRAIAFETDRRKARTRTSLSTLFGNHRHDYVKKPASSLALKCHIPAGVVRTCRAGSSFAVAQRRREMGVRAALGAQRTGILVLVLAYLATLSIIIVRSGALGATSGEVRRYRRDVNWGSLVSDAE